MQGVLANMNKIIIDNKGGSGVVPYLPLPGSTRAASPAEEPEAQQ